jgi:hypothetical protein
MPTGYTANIIKGISFESFALDCAKSISMLSRMKDEPFARVPDKFKPKRYHLDEMNECQTILDHVKEMSKEVCDSKSKEQFFTEKNRLNISIEEKKHIKKKYTEMLKKVFKWEPPTNDHKELKGFMTRQIEFSIDADCNIDYSISQFKKLKEKSGEEWRKTQIEVLEKEIKYHKEEYDKEVLNCEIITKWVGELRKSIKECEDDDS